jgi:hypothetical protein
LEFTKNRPGRRQVDFLSLSDPDQFLEKIVTLDQHPGIHMATSLFSGQPQVDRDIYRNLGLTSA